MNSGARLFTLADPSRLWAIFHVNEAHLKSFRFDQHVTLAAYAYPGQTLSGKVAFIEPTVDPSTRTIAIRVDVANPESKLKPGMSVTASVQRPMIDKDTETRNSDEAIERSPE